MEPRHHAIAAGLALSLTIGVAAAPSIYAQTNSHSTQSTADVVGNADASSEELPVDAQLPEPSSYDRAETYDDSPQVSASSIMGLSLNSLFSTRSVPAIAPKQLSWEMKYFAQNESGSNYRLGFSYGDGYNAMGFYQFDRRYALMDFMQACLNYNASKYAMFAPVVAKASSYKNSSVPMYDTSTKKLTELGQLAQQAWYDAYDQDPEEFAALQDAYGYREYYQPIENALKANLGLDISGRADCVKGLAWSLSNLFGVSGCQKFFREANLNNSMSDREFVNALCDSVVQGVFTHKYDYAQSYANRYERERATCLSYITQHEQEAQQTPGNDTEQDGGTTENTPSAPDNSTDDVPNASDDANTPGGSGSENQTPSDDTSGSQEGAGSGEQANPSEDEDNQAGSGSGAQDSPSQNEPSNPGTSTDGDEVDGGSTGTGSQDTPSDDTTPDAPSTDTPSTDTPTTPDDGSSNAGNTSDSPNTTTEDASSQDKPVSASVAALRQLVDQVGGIAQGKKSDDAFAALRSALSSANAVLIRADASDAEVQSAIKQLQAALATFQASEDVSSVNQPQTVAQASQETSEGSQEKLPATADASTLAAVVSGGLSTVGAAVAIAGRSLRGKKIPFEDGFRG